MAVKKTTVASAVSVATQPKVSNKAPTQQTDWDSMLINNNNSSEDTTNANGNAKRYEFFNGKDRLVRSAPGWGSAAGKVVEYVIFATDEDGNTLEDLPEARFGSAQDVDYYKAKYSLKKGYYVNDSLCRNGRHRITFYRIHITNVVDKPKVEEVE